MKNEKIFRFFGIDKEIIKLREEEALNKLEDDYIKEKIESTMWS